MSSYIVLTAVGPDRSGLVDEISSVLTEKKANIENSRMAVLGGEFAIILLASGDETLLGELSASIDPLEKKTGLTVQLKETISPTERPVEPSIPHKLYVTSLDHPGLVHEVTKLLHSHTINIESLDTHLTHAPITGTPIFKMETIINIPLGVKISSLKDELYDLEERLNIDIDIEPLKTM